ncbi:MULTISPECIES: hypothetical protein [Methylotenera]|uniref:hypothetical protein n=1 Tax=Methylotenera TaxID=359407 RepID=UPI000374A275|nr:MULTISPECIES: hypothetical protein [Methylotenera]
MHWKSDWLFASAVSLAFLLASGSDALQSLERKAFDRGASAVQRDAGLAYINKIAALVTQSAALNTTPESAELNVDELKKFVVKAVKV